MQSPACEWAMKCQVLASENGWDNLNVPKFVIYYDISGILCSVLNWRKLWGSNVSTVKSNPLRVSVNVHPAAGHTFYTRVRCALCTLAITNAHGQINCFPGG